eukprot:TRINITY_DN3753_c0_g1_i1.p1 TRINITY_DN3753_c0_g1~~TRINITY_DN3753_c0_g1_i1.p1  ORF type:complete len:282 (+),score=77.90 TRINITY_DN3753_c0_g1_i1:104-949(+)
MAFPGWAPPAGNGTEAEGLKMGGSPDTASSFLQGARHQFGGSGVDAPQTSNWQAQLREMQSKRVVQPTVQPNLQQAQIQQQFAEMTPQQYPTPTPTPHPQAMMPQKPTPQPQPSQPMLHQQQQQQQQQQQPPPVDYDTLLLTEEEFQANSAIEFGSGISMNGCTVPVHLKDGDELPRLEPLSASVSLRITPTAIIFLHHYDRNFILEVPISELYELTQDGDAKVIVLHTRNTNGSALLELTCASTRKRLAIYKTLCIRKYALERLKRHQQVITNSAYVQER